MLQESAGAYPYTVISAGVDWLTATRKHGVDAQPFLDVGKRILDEERAAGGDVKPATLRDYVGHRGRGFYVGSRPSDDIIQLSGPRCPPLAKEVTQASSNVSRLDVQVSVWTHGEQPTIGRDQFEHLRSLPPSRGRPRKYSLIQSHPQGETLYVGTRTSDQFGRVYDWTSAHEMGDAATVWRFEVEFKRFLARGWANTFVSTSSPENLARNIVHSWFLDRSLHLAWSPGDSAPDAQRPLQETSRDPLAWIETSVSKTVARLITQHGLHRVVIALGLRDKVVIPGKEK